MEETNAAPEYRQIKITDLRRNQQLDFDLYIFFPVNKKFIKYIRSNEIITAEILQKIQDKKIKEFFIKQTDSSKYFKYLSAQIKLGENSDIIGLKRSAGIIIDSFEVIEGPEAASLWTKNCSEVANGIIETCTDTPVLNNLYDKVGAMMAGRPSLQNHSMAVSSLSVVLGLALGISDKKNLTDLSIGGMMHDIGFTKCRSEYVEKFIINETMPPTEMMSLKLHPKIGIDIVSKNLKSPVITDNVLKIIHEHHENARNGYPQALPIPRQSMLPKIVAIADRLVIEMFSKQRTDIKYFLGQIYVDQELIEPKELDHKMIKEISDNISNVYQS